MMDTETGPLHKVFLGSYEKNVQAWVDRAVKQSLVQRIWAKDASVWTADPATQREIAARLGWLEVATQMKERVSELNSFTREIKAAGFTKVLLLGMGGSSLAPEVFQRVFGNRKGYPELLVLDSTDPERIRDVEQTLEPDKTLFIVSSKSGGTIESTSLYEYFFEKIKIARPDKPGDQFVTITDAGTPLEALAKKNAFRRIFLAPQDVGGRFSALTYFGLVPASLIGVDVSKILEAAIRMMGDCSAQTPPEKNSALILGVAMAVLAEEGRDKLTLACSDEFRSFADWAEQLVAESTGKEEVGVVPVVHEGLDRPQAYGDDRFFVVVTSVSREEAVLEKQLEKIREADHPALVFYLNNKLELGAEFFRWEMATAIACALFKINAFDQPDVQAAKDKTKAWLRKVEEGASIALPPKEVKWDEFWSRAKEGDYVSILAFLPDRPALRSQLVDLQTQIRDLTGMAVTLGIGPRYLHSTGQLHKGGPNKGHFIVITAKHAENLPVPGHGYGFRELELAQAIGDVEALENKGRNIAYFELESLSEENLGDLADKITSPIRVKE